MGDTLNKVDEAIKVVYQAPNAESGLNNIKMEVYDELSSKKLGTSPDITLDTISNKIEKIKSPPVIG